MFAHALRLVALLVTIVSTMPVLLSAEPPAAAEVASAVEKLTRQARRSLATITFTGRDGRRAGLGSGFVISADGLIATNLHVIGEARPIAVELADGRKFDVVSVHASDRLLDLAIVRIEAKDLPALELGETKTLQQGQSVIALGNPLGLQHSVVTGVVSSIREMDGRPMIQLAIPIEPGNSGGPLLDLQGRVQGILTMKSLVTANLGFALTIDTLKPLIEKPNPIPMSRWLTIGALDPRQWKPLFGSRWRRLGGRIVADGAGADFGGRSLCLTEQAALERPFELAVTVRLDDEAGAAGLAFCSDGEHKHYGFYPSAGKLRLTRFAGPDVFSWTVLHDEASDHYRAGDWNTLRVRLEAKKILCYVNDHLVVESSDAELSSVKVGLAKFRQTKAEFKNFRLGKELPTDELTDDARKQIASLVDGAVRSAEAASVAPAASPGAKSQPDTSLALLAALAARATPSMAELRRRATLLDQQAAELRALASRVHEQRVNEELSKLLGAEDKDIDLLHGALLLSLLDNDELDVEAYRAEARRMGEELAARLPEKAGHQAKLDALRKYLFDDNGFHGSRGDYYNRSNSYMNEVIDDREGLPISLSVLYIELAKSIGLKMVGVGLPGHFIVQYLPDSKAADQGSPQWIDVYEGAKPLSRADLSRIVLERAGRELREADLTPASKRAILNRMLHNLLGIAGNKSDTSAALRYLDAIVTVDPDAGQERWMRAVLNFKQGRLSLVDVDLEWLEKNHSEAVDASQIDGLRQALERKK